MEKYRDDLYCQIKDSYGKLVYTYTCHFKMVDSLNAYKKIIKWAKIILSTISTGGFIGTLIVDKQLSAAIAGICSAFLLMISIYEKDSDIDDKINMHIRTANSLWKFKERYISLLTDFQMLDEQTIIKIRDELTDNVYRIYKSAPLTDVDSYAKAQKALKSKEEQYFSQDELDKMLPYHLRNKKNI